MAMHLPTVTMNIKREYFARIVAQPCRKDTELRDVKPYWDRRLGGLNGKRFYLRLLNGMRTPVPEATILVKELTRNGRTRKYELHLGRVLQVKHWDRKRERPA